MLTEGNNRWRQFVSFLPIRSNIQRTFSCSAEIMNAPLSTGYTDFMTNVRSYVENVTKIVNSHIFRSYRSSY